MSFLVNPYRFSAAGGFTPDDLFDGDYGGYWDVSDITTLWTDTAGTTQVASDGDLVRRIDDKSGNGLNLTEATNPPTYRASGGLFWLEFDGSNDQLSGAATTTILDNSETAGGLAALAIDPDDANLGAIIFEEYQTSTRRVFIFADTRTTPNRAVAPRAGGSSELIDLDAELPDDPVVLMYRNDATGAIDASKFYVDNSVQSGTDGDGGDFSGSTTLYLGRTNAASLFFNGKFYGGIAIDRDLTSDERANLQAFLAALAGY